MKPLTVPRQSLFAFLLICAGIVAGVQVITIMNSSSPTEASPATLWTFFLGFFVTLGVIFSFIWHFLKRLFGLRLPLNRSKLTVSTRQGFLISGMVTLSLFLHSLNLLTPWNFGPLVVAVVLVEFFFQAERRPYASLLSS